MAWLIFFITVTCALCVGYAIRRGSICAVLAARTLVLEGKSSRSRALYVAAAGSGAIIVPLHWLLPGQVMLSTGYPATAQVFIAGATFGFGAWINGACALGTLAHLTGGNLRYAVTVVGMAIGLTLANCLHSPSVTGESSLRPSPLDEFGPASALFVALLALSLVLALYRRMPRWWRDFLDPAPMHLGPYRSILIVGILGGVLYALVGNWTYLSILSQRAARLVDPVLPADDWPQLIYAATVVAGGVTAAMRHGDFRLRFPKMMPCLSSFIGGGIMGTSAAVIPGGNGTLLLYAVPSLAPHAIAAYLAMSVALCTCFIFVKLAASK